MRSTNLYPTEPPRFSCFLFLCFCYKQNNLKYNIDLLPVACTPLRAHALVGTPFLPITTLSYGDHVNILVLFLFLVVKN